MHSSQPDGETEAHSSKVTSEGPVTRGKQRQAWHPPSSLLTVAPPCVARYDPCHISRKMSPPLKDGEHPPSGVCMRMSHAGRAESREVGAGHFPGKAGLKPQKPFPCRLEPLSPRQKQLLCTCCALLRLRFAPTRPHRGAASCPPSGLLPEGHPGMRTTMGPSLPHCSSHSHSVPGLTTPLCIAALSFLVSFNPNQTLSTKKNHHL